MIEIQLITNIGDWKFEIMVESCWKRAKKMTTFAKKTWKQTP